MLNSLIERAYKILNGEKIDVELAKELAKLDGEDILDLTSLANKVKNRFATKSKSCSILNTKSGNCSEDCVYCAQSAHYNTGVSQYTLLDKESVLKEADKVYKTGVRTFGLVTSGKGYTKVDDEFNTIISIIDAIKEKYSDMNVCTSLGLLSKETAQVLSEHGISEYNHNLQVDPKEYDKLVATTHTIEERLETLQHLSNSGVKICSGGIIGLGESMEQRINMGVALRDLGVTTIPINVLVPIEGTKVENNEPVPVTEIVKTVALFRLLNPKATIKLAAGRESVMKDFQGTLLLSGANSIITGGYLTTRGRKVEEDVKLLAEVDRF